MTIHKEGYPSIILTVIVVIVINLITHLFFAEIDIIKLLGYLLSGFLLITILQFFRSPLRMVDIDETAVISPCDGKVVAIEEVEEPEYFKDKRLQISIFMSPVNVHINWYPISGEIKYLKYHKGAYLMAFHPKSSTENERTSIVVEKGKNAVLLRQIAGFLARRVVYYGSPGETVTQGGQLGFIKFGSRIDLFLPIDINVDVKIGDKVKGCKSIIARF